VSRLAGLTHSEETRKLVVRCIVHNLCFEQVALGTSQFSLFYFLSVLSFIITNFSGTSNQTRLEILLPYQINIEF